MFAGCGRAYRRAWALPRRKSFNTGQPARAAGSLATGSVQNEFAEADHGAGQAEDGLVDVGSSFGADARAAEVFEPGEGAFDGPADGAQAGAVFDAAAGDDGGDAAGADQAAVLVVVVAAVGVELAGRCSGLPAAPRIGGMASSGGISWVTSLRWPPVSVPASGVPWASVIRWCSEPSLRRSTGLGPVWSPSLGARRWVESTSAADSSSRPAARSSASRRSCSCCPTPASCHSVGRRQQVAPEAPKSAVGGRFHPMPVRITYKMPSSAARSSARLRRGWRNRRGCTGRSGLSRSHSWWVRTSSRIPRFWKSLQHAQDDTPTHSELTPQAGCGRRRSTQRLIMDGKNSNSST